MQIREMGKQVQLIRASYVPAKRRSVQKVVHTFKRQQNYVVNLSLYLTASQLNDLSDAEKLTLTQWLRKKIDIAAAEARQSAIANASTNLLAIAHALRYDNPGRQKIKSIKRALTVLIKAVDRADI